jgi:hypothetical protein
MNLIIGVSGAILDIEFVSPFEVLLPLGLCRFGFFGLAVTACYRLGRTDLARVALIRLTFGYSG